MCDDEAKFTLLGVRHSRDDGPKFAWAEARLPGLPTGKQLSAAVAALPER